MSVIRDEVLRILLDCNLLVALAGRDVQHFSFDARVGDDLRRVPVSLVRRCSGTPSRPSILAATRQRTNLMRLGAGPPLLVTFPADAGGVHFPRITVGPPRHANCSRWSTTGCATGTSARLTVPGQREHSGRNSCAAAALSDPLPGVVANLIDPAGCYRTAPCPPSWAKG